MNVQEQNEIHDVLSELRALVNQLTKSISELDAKLAAAEAKWPHRHKRGELDEA